MSARIVFESPADQAGFVQMPNVVLMDASLSMPARLLYGMLLHYAREKNACYPGQARLGKQLGVTARSVQTYVRELEAAMLVRTERRGSTSNRYVLLALALREGRLADAKPASDHDAKPASGQTGSQLRTEVEAGKREASSSGFAGQLGSDVPAEMQTDAGALLRRKVKVDRVLVTEAEIAIAAAALAEFNRQAESDYGLGAHLTTIVMRVRERPSWDAPAHVRLVQSAWRQRWWERRGDGRKPTPAVVYGARAFERVVQDAMDEKNGATGKPGRFQRTAPVRRQREGK